MPSGSQPREGAVVALAGRRIDVAGTTPPRFPLVAVPMVRQHLADLLARERVVALVCAAACGADLVALEEAARLGLRRRIVLPFPPQRFRETSVVDRPGDWGPVFDRLVMQAETVGDLVVLDEANGNAAAVYAAANETILREAQRLAQQGAGSRSCRLLAAAVWEGEARPGSDATEDFRVLAAKAGFEECSILSH